MAPTQPKSKILIVDDEPGIRATLRDLLNELDVEVIEAEDGRQAWEYLQTSSADLVITDIRMPKMDGIQLCKKIAENRVPTSIIILSGFGGIDEFKAALTYGVIDLISKPFEVEIVLRRVRQALDSRKVAKALNEIFGILTRGLELDEERDFETMPLSDRLSFLTTLSKLTSLRLARLQAQEFSPQ